MRVIVTDRSGKLIEEYEIETNSEIDVIIEAKRSIIEDRVATPEEAENFFYRILR